MGFDIYQAVTDRILEMLDKGTVPWRNPILQRGGGLPTNLEAKRPYRGVNVFLLGITAWAKGYDSSYWLTFRQAVQKGGAVRKGERSSMVVFWKQLETTDKATNETKKVPLLRYYNVFNVEQCEGITSPDALPQPAVPIEPIEKAEKIVAGYAGGPKIEHGGVRAFYRPSDDVVRLPKPERFQEGVRYYSTLFHELAHSTGHHTRLDRGMSGSLAPFGSEDYSNEELVAEMGAAFLCAAADISPMTIEQSAAYIDGWRKRLKEDRKLIISAAGAGQRAADWILGTSPEPC